MKRKKLPLHLLMIRGTLGKKFTIKHYKWGIIMAKYPDMSNITASKEQRICRNIFKDAVAYAKSIIADPAVKAAWQKQLKRPNGVYNEAIKVFMNSRKLIKDIKDSSCNILQVAYKKYRIRKRKYMAQPIHMQAAKEKTDHLQNGHRRFVRSIFYQPVDSLSHYCGEYG